MTQFATGRTAEKMSYPRVLDRDRNGRGFDCVFGGDAMKCKFCNKPFLDSSRLSNHEFTCALEKEERLQRKWAEENLKRENLKRGMQ